STVSRGPRLISRRREVMPSAVSGRSSAMRAGASIVKANGSGAVPLVIRRNSTRCPGRLCTWMSCKRLPSWAEALRPNNMKTTAWAARTSCFPKRRFRSPCAAVADISGFILSVIPNTPSSIQASVRKTDSGVAFQIAADSVRYNLYHLNFRFRHRGHAAVVLSDIVARRNPVDQAVSRLHQAEGGIADLQGADHIQRVQRELLQEFTAAFQVRAGAPRGSGRALLRV